jgi:hypothetical protein
MGPEKCCGDTQGIDFVPPLVFVKIRSCLENPETFGQRCGSEDDSSNGRLTGQLVNVHQPVHLLRSLIRM